MPYDIKIMVRLYDSNEALNYPVKTVFEHCVFALIVGSEVFSQPFFKFPENYLTVGLLGTVDRARRQDLTGNGGSRSSGSNVMLLQDTSENTSSVVADALTY